MNYIIDFSEILMNKENLHEYIAKKLNFNKTYGKNLDALYDNLTSMPQCTITLQGIDNLASLEEYGYSLLYTFELASKNNKKLSIQL